LQKLISYTQQLLKEGALIEENVLDHVSKVKNVVRECNVTLRWIMLHASSPGPGKIQFFIILGVRRSPFKLKLV
jgi:WASH complex subunit strumpellin